MKHHVLIGILTSLLFILLPEVLRAEDPEFVYAPLSLSIRIQKADDPTRMPEIHIQWDSTRLRFQDQFYLLSPNRILLDFHKESTFRIEHHIAPGRELLKKYALHNHKTRVSLELYTGTPYQDCQSFQAISDGPSTLLLRCKAAPASARKPEGAEEEDVTSILQSIESRMQRRERKLQRLLNRIEYEEYGQRISPQTQEASKSTSMSLPYVILSAILFLALVLLIVFQRFTIRQLRFATLRRPHKIRSRRSKRNYFKNLEIPEPDMPEAQSLLSCYRLLGVSSDWSDEDIREHYKQLITRYHPDSFRNKLLTDEMKQSFHQRYTSIVQAYETIMTIRTLGRNVKHYDV